MFEKAIAAYLGNRLGEAVDLCRALLKDAPGHAGALHLLGMAEFKLGRPEAAETLIRKALDITPDFAETHNSLAQVLVAQGKNAEAAASWRRALEIRPDFAEALNRLGVVLGNLGQWDEARDYFSHAVTVKPDFAEAYNNLGVASHEKGDFAQAVLCAERAVQLRPDYAAAFVTLGNACRAQNKNAQARIGYEKALAIDPGSAGARNNLGLILLEAEGDSDAAAECFRKVLDLQPDHVAARTHLGITFCRKGDFAQGISCFEQALGLQPDYREALNNLGNAYRAVGKNEVAITAYRQAVALRPQEPEGHHNLAMGLLAAENFEEGWREYEYRWQTRQLAPARRDFTQPQWRGEAAAGKTLLIHAEQGFGDTIQFCRYAPLAAAQGLRVILEVQPELVRLLHSLPGITQIVARGDALPAFDLHCPMLSLPLAFDAQPETIPADIPYLVAPKNEISIPQGTEKFRVGLCWAGNPRLFSIDLAAANRRRSIAPQMLKPLLEDPDTGFYSLQKDGSEAAADLGLVDIMPDCSDFADTAALIATLDLVISVDSAVAHLAAALGKPVWLLNRYDSCWRWPHKRESSRWYPQMRIFHQPNPGDWASVIQQVKETLDLLEK